MKKIPFLILLAFCFTSLFGGIFCFDVFHTQTFVSQTVYAENDAASTSKTINSPQALESFVNSYGASDAEANVVLADVQGASGSSNVIDMSGKILTKTIGNELNPFCGTFDGKGHVISNLTIDLSSQAADTQTIYAGFFGKLGTGAKIENVTFQNLTIKCGDAKNNIYCGLIAFSQDAEISNVKVLSDNSAVAASLSVGEAAYVYAGGVFGALSGCKVSGIQIGADVNFEIKNSQTAYVGGLLGRGDDVSLKNIQISSSSTSGNLNVKLMGQLNERNLRDDFDFSGNFNFGGMAGYLENSNATNLICRTAGFGEQWKLVKNDGRIHNFGGVVGTMANSSLFFGIFKSNFDVSVEDTFVGAVNIGGIAGTVMQTKSSIVNVGMKNTFNIAVDEDFQNAFVGEVIGKISNPVPNSQNLSYIHFSQNYLDIFGDQGLYAFKNAANQDFITDDGNLDFDNLDGKNSYFNNLYWDNYYGTWDFVNTWYVVSGKIYLQYFISGLQVSVQSVDENVLKFDGIEAGGITTSATLLSNLTYGQEVKLKFSFKTLENGGNMNEFYDLATLRYNGADIAKFVPNQDEYRLSGSDFYGIEKLQENSGFAIVIKGITRATSGSYAVSVSSKKFSATIKTRLYEKDGEKEDEIWVKDVEAPGYLQNDNGTLREVLPLNGMTYGAEYTIKTQSKPIAKDGEIYTPTGEWFFVTEGEPDENENPTEILTQISNDYIKDGALIFTFGEGDFKGNFEIFAKYTSTACTGIFTFDEGVQKIELHGAGDIIIENSGDKKPISKEDPELTLHIFILKGYDFDYVRFIELLSYSSVVEGKDFCEFLNKEELEDADCYHFKLDMTTVNWANIEIKNVFSVEVKTSKITAVDNSWIWWVVGGVGGALVLAGLIVLIVWLVRRNRFGGGGKAKISKKSYKNMYY